MSAAAEIVGRLAERQPDVVRLARAASLAARIEPGLLRHLRIELLPASDAGLEADLRFSPLTHSHNVSSIVLRSELIELLREDLAAPANRPLLDRAWQIVQAKHSSAPSIIQLEERVTWLALCAETSAIDLETELMRAVRALAHQDRTGIAQWAARALPRLPVSLGSRKTFTAPGALRGDDPGKFIYFSYCLQDRDAAQHVADTLKSHGAAAWIDLELREGNVWPVAITQKIESASLIVIVMSRAALSPGPGPIKRKSLQDASID